MKPYRAAGFIAVLAAGLLIGGCAGEAEDPGRPAPPTETDTAMKAVDEAAKTGAGAGETTPAAELVTLRFSVQGMTCQGCVNAVQTVVSRLDGVASCDVSLQDNSAVVRVTDPALADMITNAINAMPDYQAELLDG